MPESNTQSVQNICILIYPGMTEQDFIGPLTVFSNLRNVSIKLAWKSKDPVTSDDGTSILPTATLEDIPSDLDVLFVGGGRLGTFQQMNDPVILEFFKNHAEHARYVTSACNGSLILAAAGLLRGYKATSHWQFRDRLADFGAIPVNKRVVQDRNRITGGGVTAGIDFGLYLAAQLQGEARAKAIQLAIEYDPQPPYDCGSPDKADAATISLEGHMHEPSEVASWKKEIDLATDRFRSSYGLSASA
jgi:cyclohexyl-isocyanide hydratase